MSARRTGEYSTSLLEALHGDDREAANQAWASINRRSRVRIQYTRDIQLRRWPVEAGETWDTWADKIAPDGTITIDDSPVPPAYYTIIKRWEPQS